jgi:hypothetical protein
MSGSIIGSYAHSTNIAIPEADTNDAKPFYDPSSIFAAERLSFPESGNRSR